MVQSQHLLHRCRYCEDIWPQAQGLQCISCMVGAFGPYHISFPEAQNLQLSRLTYVITGVPADGGAVMLLACSCPWSMLQTSWAAALRSSTPICAPHDVFSCPPPLLLVLQRAAAVSACLSGQCQLAP